MPPKDTERDYRPSYLAATITGGLIFLLYVLTLAPTTAMWDASEYIAAAHILGVPHPPGNPLFVLIGRVFAVLPIAPNVAMRVNLLAAITSAASAAMWFLITERVLVGWLAERWQRIAGGALAALIGATAFTVWNQSVVNEKVYTVSLLGLAVISWLTVRWSDDPDGPVADRLLLLIAFLFGLGYANHMMGWLAGPAVAVAVLIRRPQTLLRWPLLLAGAGVFFLGMSVYITQPIRAIHYPAINQGEVTNWDAFWYNFNRGQYGKPSVFERQAPFLGQLDMYWLYFRWQWLRDMYEQRPLAQWIIASFYGLIGIVGAVVHYKRDRRSFWYFATFMATITIGLIFYLNFKYGHSQNYPVGAPAEVRDRDYFFLVSFSAWGVWAALGLVAVWETIAAAIGVERLRIGKEMITLPTKRAFMIASPVLLFACIPMIANWQAASRAGHTDTRDFAFDMLNSVEPYGILIVAGDNDTFPLWYAQEVEGMRRDVLVANTSLLNTDWYTRQLLRRPIYEYDVEQGPEIYRGREWTRPTGPPMNMTLAEADATQLYMEIRQPQIFRKEGITATIRPQVLARADLLVLQMINDAFPERPVYFARTTGNYPEQLGLAPYVMTQGLARRLLPQMPMPGPDTVLVMGEGWLDVPRTTQLWNEVFTAPASLIRRGHWVDRASVGIPYLYISTAAALADATEQVGEQREALEYITTAAELARAAGLHDLFQRMQRAQFPEPEPRPDVPLPFMDAPMPAPRPPQP
jgi:hypothetical protein